MRASIPILTALAIVSPARASAADAPARVWAIDDGEKIRRDIVDSSLARGESNPVWSPGAPIRLFSLRNETLAVQIVIEAGDAPLDAVSVDLAALAGPGGAAIANDAGAGDPARFVGRRIERFVEHYVRVPRPSGGKTPGESIGWRAGAAPDPSGFVGELPDALIPIELAPAWDPYPMRVAPRSNAVVWIDIAVGASQPPGTYRGEVVVRTASATLATLPIEVAVKDATLAERPLRTMLYDDRDELARRVGDGDAAEAQLFQLLRRHRLTPMLHAKTAADLARIAPALDGSLYTRARGYEGAAEGIGDGVLALGAYGSYGEPSAKALADVESIADQLSQRGLLEKTETFVYAIDEDCSSDYGKRWKTLIAGSSHAAARRVRVGWTCSDQASEQPVDIVMQLDGLDAEQTRAARALGKDVWVYNGERPYSGTLLIDAPAIDPRVNGWLGAMFDVGRWFYWETTFWYDDNKGGHGPVDPYVTAETFHNADGDHAMGDGVLVYPGKQVDRFRDHSLGMIGVVPSIRLKNWRRGVEDAGYLALVRAIDERAADAIARALLPRAFSEASRGSAPAWSASGKAFFDARRALFDRIPEGARGGIEPAQPPIAKPPTPPIAMRRGARWAIAIVVLAMVAGVAAIALRRRRMAR